MKLTLRVIIVGGLLLSPGMGNSFARAAPSEQRHAKVELVSDVSAIVPGQPFNLGLHFQLDEGWHIYWKNPGDSGQAPQVTWRLPPGFVAGDLRFPVPKRNVSAASIVTNVHEGEPVLLSTVLPPPKLERGSIDLGAKLRYLICKGTCLIRHADLKLNLPVAPSGEQSEPAHVKLFQRANRALPETKSKYLSIRASIEPTQPAPGQSFDLYVDVNIKPGYHIQSHTPLSPVFIKADLFLHRTNGVSFKEAIYPPPKLRKVKFLGQVSEYAGRLRIRVPGEVDPDAAAEPLALGGVFKYQACNDKGTCFPPTGMAFSLRPRPVSDEVAGATPNMSGRDAEQDTGGVVSNLEPSRRDESGTGDTRKTSTATTTEAVGAGEDGLEGFLKNLGVPGQLLICFFYGLLINATPCVLPLLSIKVLGFVQQAHESRSRTFALGISFGVGVMVFFVVLGLLAAQGTNILQYPVAVIALGTTVTALALSMLGVYTLQVPTSATKLEASIQKEGILSSMGKGALAPVLGFACTAPLMVGGLAWATQQTQGMAILAFSVMGFGMAFPYMLLGANPHWLAFLPKPGNWMITFERIMGFLLLGLVVLLLHPIIAHTGSEGLEWTLVFLVTVAMSCWLLGKIDITMSSATRWRYRGGAAATVALSALIIYGWAFPLSAAKPHDALSDDGLIAWKRWTPTQVEKAVRSGKTVFVDVTAAYCTNCKVNKAVAIDRQATAEKIKSLGVVAFKADFTSGDPLIFQELQKFHRPGPPLNVIYPAGQYEHPIILDPLFSLETLLAKLDEAGPSHATRTAGLSP